MAKIVNPHNSFIDPTVKFHGAGTLILGKKCQIRANTIIEFSTGGIVTIGDGTVVGYGCFLQCTDTITLGRNVLIGPHCVIIASNHTVNDKPVASQPMIPGKVIIEDFVWLGANITVPTNITISKDSIIGANSFVNKQIPSGQIWAGSPIKYIKDKK